MMRLFAFSKGIEKAQSIAIATSVAALLVGLVALFLEWPVTEFRAKASLNYSTIDYGNVTCLTIGPSSAKVEGASYSDPQLGKSIADSLSIKRVVYDAAYSECPWAFFANAAAGPLFAVSEGLLPAQYLVSVGICERIDDAHVYPGKCLSKNVYVFNWRVKPRDLIKIGLVGLKPETKDEEIFTVRAQDD